MKQSEKYKFKTEIYKTGINYCVDVPGKITSAMTATKGYIKIKGTVNEFPFKKSLVSVKDGLYRLFVNIPTLKGANTAAGKTADFEIEQDFNDVKKRYPVPKTLTEQLKERKLLDDFRNLTESRKTKILKYLNNIKTNETLQKNIGKLLTQLENQNKSPRIP